MANSQAGGTLGALVLVKLDGGSSKRYKKPSAAAAKETVAAQAQGSNKSPLVKMKAGIAKYFGFGELTGADRKKALTRHRTVTINGISGTQESQVNAGSTGRSRSMKVMFTVEQEIGSKKVASVNVPMPASYTIGDMVDKLMASSKASFIARLVAPSGRSYSYATPYKKGRSTGG